MTRWANPWTYLCYNQTCKKWFNRGLVKGLCFFLSTVLCALGYGPISRISDVTPSDTYGLNRNDWLVRLSSLRIAWLAIQRLNRRFSFWISSLKLHCVVTNLQYDYETPKCELSAFGFQSDMLSVDLRSLKHHKKVVHPYHFRSQCYGAWLWVRWALILIFVQLLLGMEH